MIINAEGWLNQVHQVESPNFDARPTDSPIELIVVHNISLPPGQYGGGHVARLFTNTLDVSCDPFFAQIADTRVSAHLLIERDGRVTQFVSFRDRAWHAGASVYNGRTNCNDFSVGIELEGTDFEVFTANQYVSLNAVVDALLATYPVNAIVGHADIAPGRKTDPGPFFDWRQVRIPPNVLTSAR